MAGLTDQLIAEEGLEAVVAALAPHRDDRYVAEALFFICWTNHRDMSDVFSDEEIVEAALEFCSPFKARTSISATSGLGMVRPFQHIDYGRNDHLTDEAHFRMLWSSSRRCP